jgi:hypothetical protein
MGKYNICICVAATVRSQGELGLLVISLRTYGCNYARRVPIKKLTKGLACRFSQLKNSQACTASVKASGSFPPRYVGRQAYAPFRVHLLGAQRNDRDGSSVRMPEAGTPTRSRWRRTSSTFGRSSDEPAARRGRRIHIHHRGGQRGSLRVLDDHTRVALTAAQRA